MHDHSLAAIVAVVIVVAPMPSQADSAYPASLVERPLTLPTATLELSAQGSRRHLDFGTTKIEDTALLVQATYGVLERMTVGLGTLTLIEPDLDWSERVEVFGHYLIVDRQRLDVASGARVEVGFDGDDVVPSVTLETLLRYVAHPMLAIQIGEQLVPIDVASSAVSVELNPEIVIQPLRRFGLRFQTQVLHLKVAGDSNRTTWYADAVPVSLTALYATPYSLDVFAVLTLPRLDDGFGQYFVNVGLAGRL